MPASHEKEFKRLSDRLSSRSSSNDDPLIQAIEANDPEKVRTSLGKKAAEEANRALIEVALRNRPGSGKLAKAILEKEGVSPNGDMNEGLPPLAVAATTNNLEVAQTLLENGADVDAISEEKVTALIAATEANHLPMARLLVQNGAQFEELTPVKPEQVELQTYVSEVIRFFWRLREFWVAVKAGDADSLQKILVEGSPYFGARLRDPAERRELAIQVAVRRNQPGIVSSLLTYDAKSIDCVDRRGRTLLTLAFEKRHPGVVMVLLEFGAKLPEGFQLQDGTPYLYLMAVRKLINGEVVAFIAEQEGFDRVSDLLLDAGADVRQALDFANSPRAQSFAVESEQAEAKKRLTALLQKELSVAVRNGANLERVETLLRQNGNIEYKDPDGLTPVCRALLQERFGVAQCLVQTKACLDIVIDGRPFIGIAAILGSLSAVEKMIELGATVSQVKNATIPAVVAATECEDTAKSVGALKLLLAAKADLNEQGEDGVNAVWVAVQRDNNDALGCLLDKKANPNLAAYGYPPANAACDMKNTKALQLLVDAKANLDREDPEDFSPLLYAALCDKKVGAPMVKLLLRGGATPDKKTRRGTPQEFADGVENRWFKGVINRAVDEINAEPTATPSATPVKYRRSLVEKPVISSVTPDLSQTPGSKSKVPQTPKSSFVQAVRSLWKSDSPSDSPDAGSRPVSRCIATNLFGDSASPVPSRPVSTVYKNFSFSNGTGD